MSHFRIATVKKSNRCLNKELCLKCTPTDPLHHSANKWWFDKQWEDGHIDCPYAYFDTICTIENEDPPKKCPYILEHILTTSH
jgi:hypothetical protein